MTGRPGGPMKNVRWNVEVIRFVATMVAIVAVIHAARDDPAFDSLLTKALSVVVLALIILFLWEWLIKRRRGSD